MNPQIVALPEPDLSADILSSPDAQLEADRHVAALDRRIASLQRRKARLQTLAKLQGEVHALECQNLSAIPADHRAAAAIVQIVCSHFRVTRDSLLGPSRVQPLVHYRHMAMCLLNEIGLHSLRMVADYFGRRNHVSTFNAVRAAHNLCETDPGFAKDFDFIKHRFLKTLKELHENPLS